MDSAAGKLASGWIVAEEAFTAIPAPVNDGAAGEKHRNPTLAERSGRVFTGMKVGPELAIISDDGIRFAWWQAAVDHVNDERGPSFPEISQRWVSVHRLVSVDWVWRLHLGKGNPRFLC